MTTATKPTLAETLATLGNYSEPHPHGGTLVHIGATAAWPFYDLSDHKVIARLSGPALHLFPNDNPAALLGAFLSY